CKSHGLRHKNCPRPPPKKILPTTTKCPFLLLRYERSFPPRYLSSPPTSFFVPFIFIETQFFPKNIFERKPGSLTLLLKSGFHLGAFFASAQCFNSQTYLMLTWVDMNDFSLDTLPDLKQG